MDETRTPSLLPASYRSVLEDIKTRVRQAQVRAVLAVSRELVGLYWTIGKIVVERQESEGWGKQVIERLAADLNQEFPEQSGFSASNIWRMRAFFVANSRDVQDAGLQQKLAQLVREIPWGHNVFLFQRVKDPEQRLWYIQKTLEHGWSRAVLDHHIDSALYERQAVSEKTTNFAQTLPPAHSDLMNETTKDPYILDFLGITEEAEERELHIKLLEHMRHFLLELGVGFSFVGSKYRLKVGEEEYFPDLLFYHYRLKCFVVIELKVKKFDPRDAGQLGFYIAAIDGELRQSDDNPTIGLLLCKGKDKAVAEYALKGVSQPMGISTYRTMAAMPERVQTALPTIEQLEQELSTLTLPEED